MPMDLSKIPVLAALTRRMTWLSARQKTIAQNIANADTPGYRPYDLKVPTFRSLLPGRNGEPRLALVTSASGHLQGRSQDSQIKAEKTRQPADVEASGNAVVLEEQVAKLADTQLEYAAAANLYRKHVGLLQSALGRRNS